jgi:hypothetical protein
VYWQKRLYVALQQGGTGYLPQASKQGFISLLEFAEEDLGCESILVCIPKSCSDLASVMKTFMFLGFSVLPPVHELAPPVPDKITMCYAID